MPNIVLRTLTIILLLFLFSSEIVAIENPIHSNLSKDPSATIIQEEVEKFMSKYKIPGASLALSKNGIIVYESVFGFANKKTGELVKPQSLFRIASLSKPITTVAILSLVEKGTLNIDDQVFGENGILNEFFFKDENVKDITIRQLLNHTSGGWKNNSEDPMFLYPSLNSYDLIKEILRTTPLDHKPGTDYAYSNFGYCILGRVIEKVSGIDYEQYVKENILAQSGITALRIGGNKREDRAKEEVEYYSQEKTTPYQMQINRMDSHGGWIGSASDLLKLLLRVDGFDFPNDILSNFLISDMSTPSDANKGYALGWQVNKANNWWHTGCLPGSASLVVRTNDGYAWTLLLNSRSMEKDFFHEMDRLMWRIAKTVPNTLEMDTSESSESDRL